MFTNRIAVTGSVMVDLTVRGGGNQRCSGGGCIVYWVGMVEVSVGLGWFKRYWVGLF